MVYIVVEQHNSHPKFPNPLLLIMAISRYRHVICLYAAYRKLQLPRKGKV